MTTDRPIVPVHSPRLPLVAPVAGWTAVMGMACLYGAARVLQIEQIFNLGNFVQVFLAAVMLLTAGVCIASAGLILRLNRTGRLLAMAANCAAMVLALLFCGHMIGLYTGIDGFAAGLYHHAGWLAGIAPGYALMWLSWRLAENSTARFYLERIGIGIMLLCIIAILLIPVWEPNNPLAGLLLHGGTELIGGLLRIDSLLVLAVAGVAGSSLLYLLRHGAEFGETMADRDTWQGWFFLLPNLICFLLFFAGPLVLSFYLSFTDYNPVQASPARFTGLENYTTLLSLNFARLENDDQPVSQVLPAGYGEITRFHLGESVIVVGGREPLFWSSLFNTIFYCICLLFMSIPPALGLAMLLNTKIPGMKIFRAIFFIPSIAAVVGVALIWRWLYNDTVGYINYFIRTFIDPNAHIQWLADERVMMLSVVIMAAWQVIGFNTVIFLAGLQGVQRELLEAAAIDGAGRFARFRKVILPLLAPTTFFVTITTLIAGLQAFAEPYSLIGNNNPSNAKLTGVYYLYNEGFRNFKMGSASATAWTLFILIFAITLLQFRLSSSNQAYTD